jgi:hypothetical protein
MKATALLYAIVLASCSGCAVTVYEAAVGANVTKYMPWSEGRSGGFDGPTDVVRFTVRQESRDGRRFRGFSHISHLSAGWPVNGKSEDWLDMIECGYRFRQEH